MSSPPMRAISISRPAEKYLHGVKLQNPNIPTMKKYLFLALLLASLLNVLAQDDHSLGFNGEAEADCGTGAGLTITGTTITVEAWIYPTAFATNYWEGSIIAKDNPLYKGYVLRCGGTGQLSFALGLVGDAWVDAISPNNALALNQWQHVAGVYDGSALLLYVNGIQVQSTSESRSIAGDASRKLMIGASPGGWTRYFTGRIDEARIWNVARSAAEIRDKMFKGAVTGTGLVASYQMTDGSGTTLTDNSGNGHTGTLSINTTWETSPIRFTANALSFDGTDDVVTISRKAEHDISSAITLEAWVYATKSSGVQNVIAKSAAGGSSGYIFPRTDDGWTNTTFWLYIAGSGWRAFSAPFPGRDAWHHLAATYDGSNVKIYVDGTLQTTQAQTGAIATSNSIAITLGNQPGLNEFFGGAVDEVRVWDIVRTEAQIQASMNRELDPASQTGLVAYFTCNQGISSGTNTGIPLLQDLSGTQNGTLSNFTMTGASSNFIAQNASLRILPVVWGTFIAKTEGHAVLLNWSVQHDLNSTYFRVMHSVDGTNWNPIGEVKSNSTNQYAFTHLNPGNGKQYYRLHQVDPQGVGNYSTVCVVEIFTRNNSKLVYPNPARSGTVTVFMEAVGLIRLYDQTGRSVRVIPAEKGWQKISISGIPPGIYYLKLGANRTMESLIIE